MTSIAAQAQMRATLILSVALLIACGEAAPPPDLKFLPAEAPEAVEGVKADDPNAVWATLEIDVIQTPHSYANDTDREWTVSQPNADAIKLRFTDFDTETSYDWLEVRSPDGQVLAHFTGDKGAFTSQAFPFSELHLVFHSDYSITDYGFRIDALLLSGVGCLQDSDCGEGNHCPVSIQCITHPCFQICQPLGCEDGGGGLSACNPDACETDADCAGFTSNLAPVCRIDERVAPACVADSCQLQCEALPPPEPEVWTREGNLARGEEHRHALDVPADAIDIRVELTGSGDADLYTRWNSAPTTRTYDCRPYLNGSDESCLFQRSGGRLQVLVRGYTAASYTLRVTWEEGEMAGEGELCGSRGLSPCGAGLICAGGRQEVDVPGACRSVCEDDADCSGDTYCAGEGACMPHGRCLEVSDCSSEGNPWVHILCAGFPTCNSDRCNWECGPPPAEVEELDASGELARSQSHNFSVDATAGETVRVELTGTGDADLYVRDGAAPSTSSYDCRPYLSSANETCVMEVEADTTLHVMVRGYTASSYVLRSSR